MLQENTENSPICIIFRTEFNKGKALAYWVSGLFVSCNNWDNFNYSRNSFESQFKILEDVHFLGKVDQTNLESIVMFLRESCKTRKNKCTSKFMLILQLKRLPKKWNFHIHCPTSGCISRDKNNFHENERHKRHKLVKREVIKQSFLLKHSMNLSQDILSHFRKQIEFTK